MWQRNIELEQRNIQLELEMQNDRKAYEALEAVAREQSRMIEKQTKEINFLSATHRN